jgi:hypothetical protein
MKTLLSVVILVLIGAAAIGILAKAKTGLTSKKRKMRFRLEQPGWPTRSEKLRKSAPKRLRKNWPRPGKLSGKR